MSGRAGPEGRVRALYRERFGTPPTRTERVAGDGSPRTYLRLVAGDGSSVIGGYGPEPDENVAYLSFSRSFREIDLPVPEIYAEDLEAGVWLEEDLGDTTLFDHLDSARHREGGSFPASVVPLYRRVLEILPRFQVEGGRVVDYDVAYPREAFDRQSIQWDLNYFKYHFLKLAHVPFREESLERDFDRLARFLLRADRRHFLYRDFQSRNVMIRDGEPWFIDYQGGRRGALQYDPASLLYDAKADLPPELRDELLEGYLDALEGRLGSLDRDLFREHYRGYVLVRMMQAMGAYGYRGFYERKPRFLQSVPYAVRNLDRLLEAGLPIRLPELEAVFGRIAEGWATEKETRGPGVEPSDLRIRLVSFSYRSGYPEDTEGHGGGYVFDCRGLTNPGRRTAFADLTGRDRPVAEYLEGRREVESFWSGVRSLVEGQVRTYLERGFTSLTVAFGCTGGQHRSPYLAERLARHLRGEFPEVDVRVEHREREAWPGREPSVAGSGS